MDNVSLARWQFAITTVYHFFFVPVTISMATLVAGFQTAWVRTRQGEVPQADQVLRQALPDQLRDGRGHRHRAGVPVRDELERLLPLRRRHLRCAAGPRGPARVLPGVHLPRAVDLRLGPAAEEAPPGHHLDRRDRHHPQRLLHPGRQLLHAEPGRLHLQRGPRPGRADRLRGGADQPGGAGHLPAPDRRLLHGRRGVRGRRRGLAPPQDRQGGARRPDAREPFDGPAYAAATQGRTTVVAADRAAFKTRSRSARSCSCWPAPAP